MAQFDLGRIAQSAVAPAPVLTHPRDIYNALPSKPDGYEYLRGPQEQVLNAWYDRRDWRDLVVKMNTGGGKSIVGLTIGTSCLSLGHGPVAYLVPDHYLAAQVRDEARELGLAVTADPASSAYARGKAILVDVFARLFNGLSNFGVSGTVSKPPRFQLGTVIIDDAHACLAKAEDSFTLKIPSGHQVYDEILALFKDDITAESPAGWMDLESQRYSAIQQIPYWAWVDKQAEVLASLHAISDSDPYKFGWPLLVDVLPVCRAVITADALEISPPCLPVGTLIGFARATRRIYLTATLADDGILVQDFDADPVAVAAPIVPTSAGDIGDRLILVPQDTHPHASDAELLQLVLDLAAERNVVVIVPSTARAAVWRDHAALVLDKTNIDEGIQHLRANPRFGLVVLINRYDGIDLPDDACHVLVIDGLPEALDPTERMDQAQLTGSTSLLARQIQRLEQGMGRAVRSNKDYCVVLLLGARLAERLHNQYARRLFSPATRAQLALSDQIADALADQPLPALRQAINTCLDRDTQWVSASRSLLAPLRYEPVTVSTVSKAIRKAFDLATARNYRAAYDTLTPAIDTATDDAQRGFLMQQAAAYLHHVDRVEAQQLQVKANAKNRNLSRPREGVTYEKLTAPAREQGAEASSYLMRQYASGNELLLAIAALRGDLAWGNDRTERFEQAWSDLAWHLGFAGQRPEKDTGRGPDGLWAVGGRRFFVDEIKSGAKHDHPVYKKDAEQLSNAMDWFRAEYPTLDGTPILVHPWSTFDRQAAVPTGCRVVSVERLASLVEKLERLATGLADHDAYRDPARTSRLLVDLGFTPGDFLTRYTEAARRRT